VTALQALEYKWVMPEREREIVASVEAARGSNRLPDLKNLHQWNKKYLILEELQIRIVNKFTKPKDINALDAANKLAVVEYVDHIFKFYKSIIEEEGRDYMGSQPGLNITMRSILIVDMVRGVTVYENPFYVSPNQIRALEKRNKAGNFAKKIKEERCLNSLTH
ncbi:hypothetical protein IGI04_002385, partial [Brassica rapa subsp. trilocularis]